MTININESLRKMMGWCPNAAFANKNNEKYMMSHEGTFIDKIKGMGIQGIP